MRSVTLLLALPLLAQQQPSSHPQDRVDAAHRPLFQKKEDKSKAASALTTEAAPTRPDSDVKSPPVPNRNFINEHLFGRMKKDNVPYARLATDEEFARRAWIDATGRIPPYEELLVFLQDKDADKREKLVDKLIASDGFIDKWTYYFEDLFRAGGRMGS